MDQSEKGISSPNGGNRFCRVCGNHRNNSNAICSSCYADSNLINRSIKENADAIVWVGGAGYGVGGAYSDTFHILTDDRTQSICGRIELNRTGGAETGLSWGTPILTLQATKEWQSSLCGHCKNSDIFTNKLDRSVEEIFRKTPIQKESD